MKPILKISLAILFSIFSWALLPFALQGQKYVYKHFTVADGLPSDVVYGVRQDRKGYLWFFTEKGLAKFDGYEFKNFTVQDGLPTNDIWDLTEDNEGKLWLECHSSKLACIYEDEVFEIALTYPMNFNFHQLNVTDNTIWFEILDKESPHLYFVINDSLKRHSTYDSFRFYDKFNLNEPYTGRAISLNKWVLLGDDSLFVLDVFKNKVQRKSTPELFRLHCKEGKISQNREIHPINDGFVFTSNYGIGLVDSMFNVVTHSYSFKEKDQPEQSFDFNLDEKVILVGNNEYTLIFDSELNLIDSLGIDDFFRSKPLGSTFKDSEDNFWLTTLTDGVYLLTDQTRNSNLFQTEKKQSQKVTYISGKADYVFCGMEDGWVYQLDGDLLKPIKYSGIGLNRVRALSFDKRENLWICDRSGTYIVEPPFVKVPVHISDYFNFSLGAGYEERENTESKYAFGNVKDFCWNEKLNCPTFAASGRIYSYEINWNLKDAIENVFFSGRTHALRYDLDGKMWIGRDDGLMGGAIGDFISFDSIHEILSRKVWELEVDSQNNIWVGTDGFGVYAFNGEEVFVTTGTEGDIVSDLFVEGDSMVWVATNKGLRQIRTNGHPGDTELLKTFTTNDGLASNEVNAVYADESYIYIGTNGGLTRIDRSLPYRNQNPPLLYLNSVRVNGDEIPSGINYELTYAENELEFYFTAISYKSFGDIQYEFQLEGADNAPRLIKDRTVRYPDLKPGAYTFWVKAKDVEGIWSEEEKRFSFIINPPWWETLWFRGLVFLFIIGVLYKWYNYRMQALRKKEEERREYEKKFTELKLEALQAQMNPHFVFNALSAIQYFVRKSETQAANDYLAKFGFLMRLFLESSKNQFIPLKDELELIRLYIDLEQIRFDHKFNVDYQIDPSLNTYTTQVPSMLVQPFVENAINWGLYHREGKGTLTIKVYEDDDEKLFFEIIDDGIGREKAQEIKKNSIKNYKGRAMQIISERIKAVENNDEMDIQVEVSDLYSDRDDTGTKVLITLSHID